MDFSDLQYWLWGLLQFWIFWVLNELIITYHPWTFDLPVCKALNVLTFGLLGTFGKWHIEREIHMKTILEHFKASAEPTSEVKPLGTKL